MFQQAQALFKEQRLPDAQKAAERALALYEKEPGLDPLYVAMALDMLAALQGHQKHPELAEPLLHRALNIRIKKLGENHPYVVTSLQSLVTLYLSIGAADKALPYFKRAVASQAALTGPHSMEVFSLLGQMAGMLEKSGNVYDALAIREKELAIAEKQQGPDSFTVAQIANLMAMSQKAAGRNAAADILFRRALAITEKTYGTDNVNVGALLNNLADNLREMGKFKEADKLLRRAMSIHLKTFGIGSREVATDMANLGLVLYRMGQKAEAETMLRDAIATRQQVDPNDPNLAYPLNSLAEFLRAHARYDEAKPLYELSLELRKRDPGENSSLYATALQNLALLELERGEEAKARQLFDQAYDTYRKTVGDVHPLMSNLLRNYGVMMTQRNAPEVSTQFLEQALAIDTKLFGEVHPNIGYTLNQLGMAYMMLGKHDQANACFQKALKIFTDALGPDHPDVAMIYANLAEELRLHGDAKGSKKMVLKALKGLEKAYGENHPMIAACHNNLGLLAMDAGDLASAEGEFLKTLQLRQRVLGPHHPLVMAVMNNLIDLWILAGKASRAVEIAQELVEGWDKQLPISLSTGSETAQLRYMSILQDTLSRLVALNVQYAPNDKSATLTALRALLSWKGRVIDEQARRRCSLRDRSSPDVVNLLNDENRALLRYASLLMAGPGADEAKTHQANLDQANADLSKVQRKLWEKSAEYRSQSQPITVEAVQAVMPGHSTLVEFVQYVSIKVAPKPPKIEWGEFHYAAYVLPASGQPVLVDLGKAAPVNAAAVAYQQAVSSPDVDPTPWGNTLFNLTLARLQPMFNDVDMLIMATTFELNNVPFGALKDTQKRYVIDKWNVVYLGSGRDLLRIHEDRPLGHGSVVLANPDFDSGSGRVVTKRGISLLDGIRFDPLPGTHQEAMALMNVLNHALVVEGKEATEEHVKQVQAPRTLHIATHGFFLDDAGAPAQGTRGLSKVDVPPPPKTENNPPEDRLDVTNSLLRSGMAFAGANQGASGKDDGILTALEVSGMNLWGTGLVVLSACQTGLGTSSQDGVLGLRRALMTAGSQTQIISLWSVDDDATRELMTEYYHNLAKDLGRAEALRQAQQKLSTMEDFSHPYFWASFILIGDWRPLSLK